MTQNENNFHFQSGYLTVFQPSDITKIMGDKVVNEGGVVRLTCEAEGYPPPTIYWTREQRDEMINVWMNGNRIQGRTRSNISLYLFFLIHTGGPLFCRFWKNNRVSRKPRKRRSDLVQNGQMRVPK